MTMNTERQAFVLKLKPSGIDRLKMGLDANQIIIGWSQAAKLLDRNLDWDSFRRVLVSAYPEYETSARRAGLAAGNLWRFIREMQIGDLVVVPSGPDLYVCRITGDVTHDPANVEEDTAFRRRVEWLNRKLPIPREQAPSALYSRMKTQQTSAYAVDLLDDIEIVLGHASSGAEQSFSQQLTDRLAKTALDELRQGLMNERAFEKLVAALFKRLGADTVITPRQHDIGDDVVASFRRLNITIVAQVKYHKDPEWETDRAAVDQVLAGMDKHDADYGWVFTCGRFSADAESAMATALDAGHRVRLIDGEELAKMIVEFGMEDVQAGLA